MNDIVAEHVSLVGGVSQRSGTQKTERPAEPTGQPKLQQSDHVLHKIAEGKSCKNDLASGRSAPGKVIPMANNEEMGHFNR